MNNKVIILGARPYDFKDDTGKQLSGVSVWVVPIDEKTESVNGLIPVKYNLTMDEYRSIINTSLPATANLVLSLSIATKKVKFSKFEDVESVSLG